MQGMGRSLKNAGALDGRGGDEGRWFVLPRRPLTGQARFGNGPPLVSVCKKESGTSFRHSGATRICIPGVACLF